MQGRGKDTRFHPSLSLSTAKGQEVSLGAVLGPSSGKGSCDPPWDMGQYQELSSLHRHDQSLRHRDGKETERRQRVIKSKITEKAVMEL